MKQQDALRACGCSTVLIMTGEHGGRAMLQDTVKFKTEEEEFDITVNGYISGENAKANETLVNTTATSLIVLLLSY